MRIGETLAFLARSGSAPVRPSGAPGTAQERVAVPNVPEVDVVQLTLHNDGIWQVLSSPQIDTSFARTPRLQVLPASRFHSLSTQLYVPPGRLPASAPTRGVVLDIYV